MFSKFFTMKKVFTFLFLASISLMGINLSSDIFVFDNSLDKTSNLSIIPVSFDVETRYSDELLYGEERVIRDGREGYVLSDSGVVVVEPISKLVEIGRGPLSISFGSTTGYGADCVGCSGNVSCSTVSGVHNLISDGIYYNDSKYGSLRIVAADNSLFPCGTVMSIDNGIMDPFMAIVLDTGGAMRSAWSNGDILIDIAFSYENSNGINSATNRSGSVKFKVYRNGW